MEERSLSTKATEGPTLLAGKEDHPRIGRLAAPRIRRGSQTLASKCLKDGRAGYILGLFLIQVDGLEVAITDLEASALECARRLASNDPGAEVRVLRLEEESIQPMPWLPVAEAATA